MILNLLSKKIIGAAIEVHRELGPGLLESAYEACLCHEFELRGIPFQRQRALSVTYKGKEIDCGYRIDIIVDKSIILELKACSDLEPIHKAQILTYLKLMDIRLGLLINFNVHLLKNGIVRVLNGRLEEWE